LKFILAGLGNWYAGLNLVKSTIPVAERLGFWGVGLPDHYMWGTKMGGESTLDSWVLLTYLASRTESLRLGTLVTPIPLRPPSILAKVVSTLDLLSGGRVFLGVGSGWSKVEFEGYSEWDESRVRVDKTEEGLQLILKLWITKKVTFHGKYYHAKNAVLEPKPFQNPHPQLLFAGFKSRMLRLAGRYGNICYIPPIADVNFLEGKQIVLGEARRFKRKKEISFADGIWFDSNYDPKLYANRIELARQRGCDYFVVPFRRDQKFLNSMKDFGKNVLPSFS